ncbi:zinc finger, CCHC-type containing protein [Tanacetum coccineum]
MHAPVAQPDIQRNQLILVLLDMLQELKAMFFQTKQEQELLKKCERISHVQAGGRSIFESYLSLSKQGFYQLRAEFQYARHGEDPGRVSEKPKGIKTTKLTLPPPKKDNPAKDAICHQCGEVGHWRRNCPVYLTELMKKKKLPQGASAFRGRRKLKQALLCLYVGRWSSCSR